MDILSLYVRFEIFTQYTSVTILRLTILSTMFHENHKVCIDGPYVPHGTYIHHDPLCLCKKKHEVIKHNNSLSEEITMS
jgi:hypothetical protein